VAASLTVAEHLLPVWIGDLRRSSPDLRLGRQVCNSARVCELARDATVDVGFVAPHHRWTTRGRPVGAEELAATPMISRETAQRAIAAAGALMAPPLLELGSQRSGSRRRVDSQPALARGTGPVPPGVLHPAAAQRAG
jgi:DNA-binding transcriptional LysR family regulator